MKKPAAGKPPRAKATGGGKGGKGEKMDEAERAYLATLKQGEPGTRVRLESGEAYAIRIIGRGEHAFYQQNDRALMFQIEFGTGAYAGSAAIYPKTIRRWDDDHKVTPAERDLIVERMSDYLRSTGISKILLA